jgi:hypothetical protein
VAVDFDFFSNLDVNLDDIVDTDELKLEQLQKGNSFTTDDLNNNGIFDKFESDLDMDGNIDLYQAEINAGAAINHLEEKLIGISFEHDINHSKSIDQMDMEIAKLILK